MAAEDNLFINLAREENRDVLIETIEQTLTVMNEGNVDARIQEQLVVFLWSTHYPKEDVYTELKERAIRVLGDEAGVGEAAGFGGGGGGGGGGGSRRRAARGERGGAAEAAAAGRRGGAGADEHSRAGGGGVRRGGGVSFRGAARGRDEGAAAAASAGGEGRRELSRVFLGRDGFPRERFVGLDVLKQVQADQLACLREYADAGNWAAIAMHTVDKYSGFDWWMFPVDRESRGKGRAYALLDLAHIVQLATDDAFMESYLEGVQLVARSYGWDLDRATVHEEGGHQWRNYPIRLAKMLQSLALFAPHHAGAKYLYFQLSWIVKNERPDVLAELRRLPEWDEHFLASGV